MGKRPIHSTISHKKRQPFGACAIFELMINLQSAIKFQVAQWRKNSRRAK